MRPGSVVSGAAFITALLSVTVFLLVLCIAGFSVYRLTERSMMSLLEDQINEELQLFEQILENDGQRGLSDAISRLSARPSASSSAVALYDPQGAHLAGMRGIAPDFVEWSHATLLVKNTLEPHRFKTGIRRLSTATIVVGRSTELIQASLARLDTNLKIAGAVVVLLTSLIGYVASQRVRSRLQKISDALFDVSEGQLDTRLPVYTTHSQIDLASREINRHLDSLEALMATTRNTIQAIAHDLRSPLSRANMLLQSLEQDETLDQAHQSQLNLAQAQLDEVSNVFNTILRIAKLSSTQSTEQFEHFPVVLFVSDLVELFQPIVEENQQSINFRSDCTAQDTLFGDLRMLRQMMVNLIENAVRHAGAGAALAITAECNPSGGTTLCVCDDGPGIPAAVRDQVLEPFFRQDRSRTSQGNGLGLALVAAIVKRHGAVLTLIDNRPGLCVKVTFPDSNGNETAAPPL